MTKLITILFLTSVVVTGCVFGAPASVKNNESLPQEEIDISEWKTYRNEEFGFEFKYPADLEVLDLKYNRIGIGKNFNNPEAIGYKYLGEIIFEILIKDENAGNDGSTLLKNLKIGNWELEYSENVQGIDEVDVYLLDYDSKIILKILENTETSYIENIIESIK